MLDPNLYRKGEGPIVGVFMKDGRDVMDLSK